MSTKNKPRTARSASTGKRGGKPAYKVAGKTSDGVTILRATVRPTHFTPREIRKAITAVGRQAADR